MAESDVLRQLRAELGSAPQKQPTRGRGGFLTSLISEAGGTGGAVGGAALGTAILPGIGTLLGAGIGGFLGGTGGRLAENKVRDDEFHVGQALGEGAISGLAGAGPLRLGKAALGAAKGVRAGSSLADAIVNAGEGVAKSSITGAVGNKLTQSGTNMIAKEFRLNPTQQFNFKKLTGEEATSVLRRYGIKRPEDIANKIQPLQDAFDTVIDSIPAVNKTQFSNGLKNVYQPLLKSPALFEQQLGKQLKAQADELVKSVQGGKIDASTVNELRKTFDNAVKYTQRGAPDYNIVKETADALRGLLQKEADKAGVQFNGQSFKNIGLELRKLRNLNELVGKQEYLGSGSLPLNLPNLLGAGAGAAAGGIPGIVAGGVIAQGVNSAVGRRAVTSGLLKAGEGLSTKAAQQNPFGIKNTAMRVAAGSSLDNLGQSSMGNSIANNATTNNATAIPNAANMGGLSQTNGDMSSPFGITQENYLAAVLTDLQETGGKNLDTLKALYEQFGPQKQDTMSAEASKTVTNAETGLQALSDFENIISNDPSALQKTVIPGRGAAGGLLGRALGTQSLDAARQQIVDIIARLRTGAAITNDEAARFTQFLPTAADTPDVAAQKIGYLRNQFQNILTNTGGNQPSSLEEALMQQTGN